MFSRVLPMRLLVLPLVLLVAAGCQTEAPPPPPPAAPVPPAADVARAPSVLDAYAPAAPEGGTGALFFTVTGGSVPDTLVEVSFAGAERVEVHETYDTADGLRGMRAVGALPVAAADTVRLAPGGYHVMLIGLRAALAPGDTLAADVRFARGGTVAAEVVVRALDAMPHGSHR